MTYYPEIKVDDERIGWLALGARRGRRDGTLSISQIIFDGTKVDTEELYYREGSNRFRVVTEDPNGQPEPIETAIYCIEGLSGWVFARDDMGQWWEYQPNRSRLSVDWTHIKYAAGSHKLVKI